ncbi:MAG: hypothetical protein PWQ79_223 [Thermococcaceae archaeon]|nr:hypothetical protein [Thermococcaceae archaeon]MDK2913308.1 hypothetical protein [Thermococcaceae archaeon]
MIEWAKTYWKGGVVSISLTRGGDVIAAGVAEKEVHFLAEYGPRRVILSGGFVARLGRDGSLKWFRIIPWVTITDAEVTGNGEVVLVGVTNEPRTMMLGVILKFDGNGNFLWGRRFNGGVLDSFNALTTTRDGGAVVVGETRSFGAGVSDALVLRLDGDGNFTWWGTYGGKLWDGAESVTIDREGRIVVAGYTYSFSEGPSNAWLLWLDNEGDVLLGKTYGTESLEKAVEIVLTPEGDPVVVGKTYVPIKSRHDAWAIRLDGEGEPEWGLRFPGMEAVDIAVSPSGDLVLAMEDFELAGIGSTGEPLWGERLKLKMNGGLRTVLADEHVLVGGGALWGIGEAFIASIRPEGEPPAVLDWNPGVKESECTVFRAYANGEACFKATPVGKLTEVRLKPVEFKPEVFSSFREFAKSCYVRC